MGNANNPGRSRIGAGHRRRPGDVVTGTFEGRDFIGRIVYVSHTGTYAEVRPDGVEGAVYALSGRALTLLRTIEEVDAPTQRTHGGSELDERVVS